MATQHRPVRLARVVSLSVAAALALGSTVAAAPAYAAESSIDHVQPKKNDLQTVISLADVPVGVTPDLGTVTATFAGAPVEATAELLSGSSEDVERTAVLAIDVSESMAGARFASAKAAANAFLDNVPSDLSVGIVTFAAEVTVAQAPTRDLAEVRGVLETLELSRQTRAYDGLIKAVEVSGTEGARSILLLSDGADTSATPLSDAITAVEESDVRLDVVALAQNAAGAAPLRDLAEAGDGRLLNAKDPAALGRVFAAEAQVLAQQVLVTVYPTAALAGKEGTLEVTLQVDGEPTTDGAFVGMPARDTVVGGGEIGTEVTPVEPGLVIAPELMYAGLGAAVLGLLFMVVLAVGSPNRRQDAVDLSIEAYTRQGAKRLAEAGLETASDTHSITQQAVAVAENVLENQKGLEAALNNRLEAAGLSVKPAEWLLVHAGVAIGIGVIATLVTGGNPLIMLGAFFIGVAAPWFYLSTKKRRRFKAFNAQLADTLQLMAGSLSAGLSLPQSVDTVVREGSDPMSGELRRAIVETRLGVEIEDALLGVAERMGSVDFEWVVMAIRIQREVGGNLSELLNSVAETIREREYLERQVQTLSAEGRLSVWILGGLPPAFLAYLMVANMPYVQPLFTTPLGLVMMTVMVILLSAGIFWMKKVVKVEV
jgi:tight adherence protein B